MNEFLWVEKYRPANIADCVLPDRIKQNFEEIVKQGEICLLYTSPSPRDGLLSRMPSSA